MEELKLTFVGDISFNDSGKNEIFDSENFMEINSCSDFTIGNLEALAGVGDVNLLKIPRVTTNIESLSHLKRLNMNLVTLAHNHVYDASFSGFLATVNRLKELGISYIGAGLTKEEARRPYVFTSKGMRIGFLNYCNSDTNPSLPLDSSIFLNEYNLPVILEDIRRLKQTCDHVILLLHWGGRFEGGYFPDDYQVIDALEIAKAGASAIIGHHPHTLQPSIISGKTPVYYSLGNFIFYDIKHENQLIKLSPRRRNGGLLNLVFSKTDLIQQRLYFTRFSKNKVIVSTSNYGYKFRSYIFSKVGHTLLFKKMYRFQYKFINPLLYFLFIQEGGFSKFKRLNIKKIKRFLWKI